MPSEDLQATTGDNQFVADLVPNQWTITGGCPNPNHWFHFNDASGPGRCRMLTLGPVSTGDKEYLEVANPTEVNGPIGTITAFNMLVTYFSNLITSSINFFTWQLKQQSTGAVLGTLGPVIIDDTGTLKVDSPFNITGLSIDGSLKNDLALHLLASTTPPFVFAASIFAIDVIKPTIVYDLADLVEAVTMGHGASRNTVGKGASRSTQGDAASRNTWGRGASRATSGQGASRNTVGKGPARKI